MKTSGVSQQAPPQSTKATTQTTGNKSSNKADSKPQKEFKEVLDSDPPKGPPIKGKFQGQGLKGAKLPKGEAEGKQQPQTLGRKNLNTKGSKEDVGEGRSKKEEVTKKSPKENQDLKEFNVPTHVMMGPSTVNAKAEMQKTSASALNIREIESIVQKVQVGINEKGLPEMNFELMTDKLGPLNLKVSSENDKINIQFVAENASAQAELQKGINDLSQLLGQRGLNLAETNVMTRDQQSQQQQDRGRGDSESSYGGTVEKTKAKKRNISGPSDDGFTI